MVDSWIFTGIAHKTFHLSTSCIYSVIWCVSILDFLNALEYMQIDLSLPILGSTWVSLYFLWISQVPKIWYNGEPQYVCFILSFILQSINAYAFGHRNRHLSECCLVIMGNFYVFFSSHYSSRLVLLLEEYYSWDLWY